MKAPGDIAAFIDKIGTEESPCRFFYFAHDNKRLSHLDHVLIQGVIDGIQQRCLGHGHRDQSRPISDTASRLKAHLRD